MRKTVCTRTNPTKVEELIRAGGGVQTPLDGDDCPACRQPWDRSHMLMIYDVEEIDPKR